MSGFFVRLRELAKENHSQVCVGLDPDPDRIPGGADSALRHCLRVVEATRGLVCCYKPNSAFWEQYGADGFGALAELRARVPASIPFLYDAKRGDLDNTNRAYARAAFDVLKMDAITLHGYLGRDSLTQFASRVDRGCYLVCRTSNPSAEDLQHRDVEGAPLYIRMVELAEGVNQAGNLGLVVGATAPEQIAEIRRVTDLPFLIPGIGAQGGDLEGSVRAAWNGDQASCVINASRSILFAPDPRQAAQDLRDHINRTIGGL